MSNHDGQIECVIPAHKKASLKGVVHADFKQFLDYRIGKAAPIAVQELVGQGKNGEHLKDSVTGQEKIHFAAEPVDRTLYLTAYHERDGKRLPSDMHSKRVDHKHGEVLLIFVEDGGEGLHDIDYNDMTASVHIKD